jgi:hypothetical protein
MLNDLDKRWSDSTLAPERRIREMRSNTAQHGHQYGHERTNTEWAALLAIQLDALEEVIRQDLRDRRAEKNQLRRMDLEDGLRHIADARAALVDSPEGARLAFSVLGASLARLRMVAEDGMRYYQNTRKGAAATKAKFHGEVVAADDALRAHAAKLDSDLSDTAKAKILARFDSRSVRQIRRIIAK